MGTDDDVKKNNLQVNTADPDDVSSAPSAESVQDDATNGSVELAINNFYYTARLRVDYWWSLDGRTLNAKSVAYLMPSSRSGVVHFGISNELDEYSGWHSEPVSANSQWQPWVWELTIGTNGTHAKIHFHYDHRDSSGTYPRATTSSTITYVPPPPTIDAIRNVGTNTFRISGSASASLNGSLYIYQTNGNQVGAPVNVVSGHWSTNVSILPGYFDIEVYALQKVGSAESDRSPTSKIYLVGITAPANGSVLKPNVTRFSGRAAPGTLIKVVRSDNHAVQLAPDVYASTQGTWSTGLDVQLPSGSVTVTALFSLTPYPSGASETINYVGVGVLQITGPSAAQPMQFTVTGTNGIVGATVAVKIDTTTTVVGRGSVTAGGNWSAEVQLTTAGRISLVADQTFGGVTSERSIARAFDIHPPALTNIVFTSTGASVKFEGSGYTGATVQIDKASGPDVTLPAAVSVNNGRWEMTATNWPFGTYRLRAIQKVSNNAGGWIESQPYEFSVNHALPDPSDVTYTRDYQPAFSGRGFSGATVRLYNPGGASEVAPRPTVSGGQWSSTASEVWGPTLDREVHIKQYSGDASSPNWVKLNVTLPPLAPVMNEPVENGFSPDLSGTCWPGAVLTLKYSDNPTEHPVPNNAGSWSFRRPEAFAPDITHTATITQTAAGQTSPEASRTFVVRTPIPKPDITDPQEDEEVGRAPKIRGRGGMGGATMQLRDAQFGRDLGASKVLEAEGEWSIDLVDLEFREYTIEAKQTIHERSETSDHRQFSVVLLPPLFDVPQPGDDLPRTAELSGTGMPQGRVEVWLEGGTKALLKDIGVDGEGRWQAQVTLPIGVTTIYAKQFFEGLTSKDSPLLTYNVVPAAPFIETPATGEHIGKRAVVSGFGVPGDSVTVRLKGPELTVLGRSPVLDDRTWSVTVAFGQPGGRYGLVAVASCEGFDSSDSPERAVELGTYLPSIDAPTAGHWIENPVAFQGQGRPGTGRVVSWFNPDQAWAWDLEVETGQWRGGATQPLPAGGNWCRFKQTVSDSEDGATVSDWVESPRFETLRSSTP